MPRATGFHFIGHRPDADDNTVAPVGGIVIPFTAAAALNSGDVVYLSGAGGIVNKSAVSALYSQMMGVVVGGKQTYGNVINTTPTQTGILAANANEEVLVQVSGIAYVVCAAAVAAGGTLQVATTAGRVDDIVVVAGQVVGTAIDTGAGAASVIRMLIDHR